MIAPPAHAAPAFGHLLAPIDTPYGTLPVRLVRRDDVSLAQDFVANLSPTARYYRFFQMVSKLQPMLLERFLAADGRAHVAVVALAPAYSTCRIVAEARYVVAPGGNDAEFAVAIADDWCRLGLARTLLDRLAVHANAAGVRRLVGQVLADNEPMLAFARATGVTIEADVSDFSILTLSRSL